MINDQETPENNELVATVTQATSIAESTTVENKSGLMNEDDITQQSSEHTLKADTNTEETEQEREQGKVHESKQSEKQIQEEKKGPEQRNENEDKGIRSIGKVPEEAEISEEYSTPHSIAPEETNSSATKPDAHHAATVAPLKSHSPITPPPPKSLDTHILNTMPEKSEIGAVPNIPLKSAGENNDTNDGAKINEISAGVEDMPVSNNDPTYLSKKQRDTEKDEIKNSPKSPVVGKSCEDVTMRIEEDVKIKEEHRDETPMSEDEAQLHTSEMVAPIMQRKDEFHSKGKSANSVVESDTEGRTPELSADSPGPSFERKKDDERQKTWLKLINMVWRDIANHKNAAVFMNPIKEQQAPNYYEIVKRPIDLKSIKQRVRDGKITTTDEFHRDVMLMFANAAMYNKEDSNIYNLAQEMKEEVEQIILAFKRTENITQKDQKRRGETPPSEAELEDAESPSEHEPKPKRKRHA
ncbi:uncharacterized protein VTP21DRAFT_7066 [Calcarisporiella thermophila]|uniref:uncharacterized protein n=1 Tax=Calcarisporiella thermophila TaxID=911321 RepID=UPI003744A4EB